MAASDPLPFPQKQERRPSLLSTSVSRAEYTSYDLGVRDGSPRVITYVKASQGFVWNHEIFLPRESEDGRGGAGECWGRQEGVVEIRLSEEDRYLPA